MSDYDSIYLVPKEISTIRSRNDVDLHSDFMGLFPIISSPMRGISGWELVSEMGRNNTLGILHRFSVWIDRKRDIREVFKASVSFGVAIGTKNFDESELPIAEYAVDHGAVLLCVDVANGYLPQIAECGKKLKNKFGNNVKLMTGNVINKLGAEYVKDSGFDFVRVSIGSGGVCTTRQVTGISRNPLVALNDCKGVDINLVIDGGIKQPGDIVKSFAVGSNFAMLGSVLAYANEAEDKTGKLYGMASMSNHELNSYEIKSIEGKDTQINIEDKKPLKEILDQFLWGIKSACTYLNCSSYKQIYYKANILDVNERLKYENID
jgi:IMP dehydrogenase/GMP reductase